MPQTSPRLPVPLVLLALVACGRGTASDSTETGSPSGTLTTGSTSPVDAELIEGAPVTCVLPAARASGYYDRRTAPHPPSDGAHTWGGGVISADLDGDGILDLVAATQAGLQLFLTQPGPTPSDVSFDLTSGAFAGIALDYAVGGTAVDIDADGDKDLVIARWERPNRLLLNQGDHFTDATPAAWNAHANKTQSASVGDMDGDGDLDLFFGSYGNKPDAFDDQTMPPADPAELYRNDGNGWVDVSDTLPAEVHDGYTFASGWWDLAGDGTQQLVVANDFGKVRPTVRMYADPSGWQADTSFHPGWEDMGMAVADVNGDAVPDFLFSSWKAVSMQASVPGFPGLYAESNDAWSVNADVENRNQVYGWGAEFGDLDNDTDLDAMVLFSYWSAYTEAGDPIHQVDALFEQLEPDPISLAPQFTQRGGEPEWQVNDNSRGRGLIFADLNDDGYLDVVKGHPESASVLYLSRCGAESWTRLRLRQNGPNRDAIGARIELTVGESTQNRWMQAGSSGMYGGAPLEAHFGLGQAERIDSLSIHWPDGGTSTFTDVNPRRVLTVVRANTP